MMCNSKIVLFIVGLLLFAVCPVLTDTTTTSLLTNNNPVVNQMMTPSQQVIVQYTINGLSKNGTLQKEIPNYPSSLDVILRWTEKNSTQQHIELIALNGLNTDPDPAGVKNQVYSHRWKLPNCHFFARYVPSEWSFSLIFEPKYPGINNNTVSAAANKVHATVAAVPLGPQQAVITFPINVNFNATLMTDPHHKGC